MSPAGRPKIGKLVGVRFDPDLLAIIDEYAKDWGCGRAEAIRNLVRCGIIALTEPPSVPTERGRT